MAEIRVGDRVRVKRSDGWDRRRVGRVGVLNAIDVEDDDVPFRVVHDGGEVTWAEEVEPVNTSPASSREALVTRAKALLEGTAHTGADVVAMAAFLAGG